MRAFTTIAHASLTLVSRPAAHTRRLSAFLDRDALPSCLLISSPPLGVLSRSSTVYEVRMIVFKTLFSAQRFTARRPHPGSFGPCNDPRSASPYVRAFYYYCTRFTNTYIPAAACARRLSAFHGSWPLPSCLPVSPPPLGVLSRSSALYKVRTIGWEALLNVQRLTVRKPRPGSIRPRNDPGSASPMYVRFTTIAHGSLTLVSRPAAHARRLSAFHGPWPPPLLLAGFSAAPRRALKVLRTLQGEYDRLGGLVECPTAYSPKTSPRLDQTA